MSDTTKELERLRATAVLIREKVCKKSYGNGWFHEYGCPKCGKVRLKTHTQAKLHPMCTSCSKVTHGLTYTDRRYNVWANMKDRCTNPKNKNAKNYILRGITVCAEWMTFDGFMKWEKFEDYKPGLQIDRIDNDKGYSPDNCRWATPTENNRNTRANKLTPLDIKLIRTLRDSGMKQKDIAESIGVSQGLVSEILAGKKWQNV